MANIINKILVDGTTYEITPSSDGTFSGTSEDNISPSSWTDVAVLASGETNGSIFTKISNMFKNIRYLYSKALKWTIDNDGTGETSLQATIQNDIANNVATGLYSHAEGTETTATGQRAHAEGKGTAATANGTHAEGYYSAASGSAAHAEGTHTVASGIYGSHAEGNVTVASGQSAHAEGEGWAPNGVTDLTYGASGQASHSEGSYTKAQGNSSHAEGCYTVASGVESHAEGYYTTASGIATHSEGEYTIANHRSQHVFGEYNTADPSTAATSARGNYIEIVGNGTTTAARSNARTLDWSGNETLAGKLTVGTAPTANMDVATKQYVDGKQVYLTQAEYDALTPAQKSADVVYYITDSDYSMPDVVTLSKAEYDLLPTEEKNNGLFYYVYDDTTTASTLVVQTNQDNANTVPSSKVVYDETSAIMDALSTKIAIESAATSTQSVPANSTLSFSISAPSDSTYTWYPMTAYVSSAYCGIMEIRPTSVLVRNFTSSAVNANIRVTWIGIK